MAITYSISGGADAGKFNIDGGTGKLTFKAAPDFENPGDANKDNIYEVTVKATDAGGASSTQDMRVTVKDVSENLPPQITSAAAVAVNENQTDVATVTATDPDDGGVTPPDPPIPPDPTGWDDGTANAPTGTPQFPNALNNYPAGHGRRDKTVANQPPFNVPGVDYRVGIQAGVTMKTPSASNMPAGCTFNNGNITVNGTNVVLEGFNMGNGQITVNSKSGTLSIKNCKWNLTSGHDPIYFYQTNVTARISYCEMYCNGQNTPNGFVGITITASDAGGDYTIEYCYLEKAYADGFDWRGSAGGSFTLQYCCLYDTGNGIGAGAHPDFIQIQSFGPQKIWNNFGWNPNYGSQGFGAWDVAYPANFCQNVSITPGGNAYSINTGHSSFTTTKKFVFHNNYVDNKNSGAMLYPGYDKTKSDVKGNIQLVNGQAFS